MSGPPTSRWSLIADECCTLKFCHHTSHFFYVAFEKIGMDHSLLFIFHSARKHSLSVISNYVFSITNLL